MQPLALLMAAYLFLLGGPKDVKEAVKLNGECLKKMPKPGQANSDEFINCVLKLEDLVTKVAEDRHIDLLKCKPNPADPSKNLAWCPVWAWWHKTEVMVTNPDLVQAIRDKKDITAIEPTMNKNPDKEARISALKSTGIEEEDKDDPRKKLVRRKIKSTNSVEGGPAKTESDRRQINQVTAGDGFAE